MPASALHSYGCAIHDGRSCSCGAARKFMSRAAEEAREEAAFRELYDAAKAARARSWVDIETTRRFAAAMDEAALVLGDQSEPA